jgi:hypothetical protein
MHQQAPLSSTNAPISVMEISAVKKKHKIFDSAESEDGNHYGIDHQNLKGGDVKCEVTS